MSGSLALGLLLVVLLQRFALTRHARALAGTGFLGAYTTFSTFAFETVRLAEGGAVGRSIRNVVVNTVGGLFAAATGLALAAL